MKVEGRVTDEDILKLLKYEDRMSPEEIVRREIVDKLARENFAKLSDEERRNLTFGRFLELAYPLQPCV